MAKIKREERQALHGPMTAPEDQIGHSELEFAAVVFDRANAIRNPMFDPFQKASALATSSRIAFDEAACPGAKDFQRL